MNTKYTLMTLLLLSSYSAWTQNTVIDQKKNEIFKLIEDLKSPVYGDEPSEEKPLLVNMQTLNNYFNNRVSGFLTGEEDVSLYKNYAVVNSEENRLFIGRTFTKKDATENISRLFTGGLHMDIDKGFAKLIDDASVQNNIGMSGRLTLFTKGYLNYVQQGQVWDQMQKSRGQERVGHITRMQKNREVIGEQVRQEFVEALENFTAQHDRLKKRGKLSSTDLNKLVLEFFKAQTKAVTNSFVEKEMKALGGGDSFSSSTKAWVSIFAYVPFTVSEYPVAPEFSGTIVNEGYYPWELSVSMNGFKEVKGKFDVFWFLKVGAVNSNSVKLESISSFNISEYRPLGGTDTLKLATLTSDKVYIGDYENMVASKISGQIGMLFHSKKSIRFGVNLELEKVFTTDFDVFNLDFGIPISMKGKKKTAPVNIEPILRIPDLLREETKDDLSDRLTIGFALGLPFGNTLYE